VTDSSAPEDTEQPLCGRLAERYSHWRHDPFWNESEQRPRAPARLVGSLVVGLVVLVGIVALGAIGRWVLTVVIPQWVAGTLVGQVVAGLGPDILGAGAVTLAVIAAAVLVDRRQISDLGFSYDRSWIGDFGFGCLLGLGLSTSIVAIEIAAGWITVASVLTGTADQAPVLYVLYQGVFYLCVGLREEIVFRGYLLPNIAEGFRGFESVDESRASYGAVGVTAVLFSLFHLGDPLSMLLTAGLFGIVFGIAYLLTDSLAIPIGLHATWNLGVAALYGPFNLRTGGKLIETVTKPVGILSGNLSSALVVWGAIGGVLLLILLYVRLRTGELQIQPSVSEPSFHDSQISSPNMLGFDGHDDEAEPPRERALTDEERHRLSPLIDKTDIPVKVKSTLALTTDDNTLSGGLAGWCPSTQRIVLDETYFDRDDNEAALGVLAHGIGQYTVRHHLKPALFMGGVSVVALIIFINDIFGVFYSGQQRLFLDMSYIGVIITFTFCYPGFAILSRHLAHNANKYGSTLLGSTEPLETLYRSGKDVPRDAWWEKLYTPRPSPADQLAVLEKFSVEEDDSMSTVSRWLSDRS
jgi:membrane protease YdiL (CAAX protease family)